MYSAGKPYLKNFSFTLVFLFTIASSSLLASDDRLYVISSSAKIRGEPNPNGKIIGVAPIGYSFKKDPGADKEGWTQVQFNQRNAWGTEGYISKDVLSDTPPSLQSLLKNFNGTSDQAIKEKLMWAERAFAFAPANPETQRTLLHALKLSGDTAALEAASKKIALYNERNPILPPGEPKIIAIGTTDDLIYPIASINEAGEVIELQENNKANVQHFMEYGRMHYLINQKINQEHALVDGAAYNCSFSSCSSSSEIISASFRKLGSDSRGESSGTSILSNFPILISQEPKMTKEIHEQFKQLALECLASDSCVSPEIIKMKELSNENLLAFKQMVASESPELNHTEAIGTHHGLPGSVLVGIWTMGSQNGAHYNGTPFISLFVIANKESDNKYQVSYSSLAEEDPIGSGCSYLYHADLNGDKSDEFIFDCKGVEGNGQFLLLTPTKNGWKNIAITSNEGP